ncbi:glycosyltransferase family 2 protein [Aurantimonas sp. A2-1-M11]|uniref:glycosyltransferase family 2 protein n=1 Tax=Aurantimonas sp. A2-1-M11 TaxID=3113712 RepID=UPI002F91C3FF
MKISIVMPSFNQAKFVENSLLSVFSQDYENWEILFVDGESTDDTMQIVDRYRDRISFCVSEPDKGQSDALRKGFSHATGDVLTWLNTDDLLLPGSLSEVSRVFLQKPALSWVLGNVIWIDNEDIVLKCWKGEGFSSWHLSFGLLAAGGPSAFFSRELYDRVGGINVELDYQMDTELWWRFALAKEEFVRLKGYTWALRLHRDAKVSGHMFAADGDPHQKAIAESKRSERTHVELVRDLVATKYSRIYSPPLSALSKLTSFSYLSGSWDNFINRGKKLSEIF